GRKKASELRLHSHHAEEVRGRIVHPEVAALAFGIHPLHLEFVHPGNIIENVARLLPYLHEVRVRKAVRPAQVLMRQEIGELLWLLRVYQTEQEGVHHAEDGSVRTDAQRKRQYARQRESRLLVQSARSMPQVVPEDLQREAGARFPHLLLHLCEAS